MRRSFRLFAPLLVALAGALGPLAALAQVVPAPQNVLNLAAQASAEVTQDLLTITLAATREGADAGAVQSQLRQVLDTALAAARQAARPGQVEVRTGAFALFARYAQKGGIVGWQGSAELIVEGRDTAAISQLGARLAGMTVARVGFGLSREAREKVEADLAAQAIGRFKARAGDYAHQFGFGGYSLREVTVGGADAPPQPMYRARVVSAAASADEALPVQAGRTTVTVSVAGSIQMSAR